MSDLTGLTLKAAADAIKSKSVSSVELTKAFVEAVETARPLNAYVLETPEKALVVCVHPAIAGYLQQDGGSRLKLVQQKYDLKIQLEDDYNMHREDIKILSAKSMREVTLPEER